MKHQSHRIAAAYYRERAPEYDMLYQRQAWQDDLRVLREWVASRVAGRTVLEIASGTGYWTELAASVAGTVVACDLVPETLAIAAKRRIGRNVSFVVADAYALPFGAAGFDVVMANLWWSHVLRQGRFDFLSQIRSRLARGGVLIMIDQLFVPDAAPPVSRWDAAGNRYEMRRLSRGTTYEIVKNYASESELRQSLSTAFAQVRVRRLSYLWSVEARLEDSG